MQTFRRSGRNVDDGKDLDLEVKTSLEELELPLIYDDQDYIDYDDVDWNPLVLDYLVI